METGLRLWQVLVVLGLADLFVAMLALLVSTRGFQRFTGLRLVLAGLLAFPILLIRTLLCLPQSGGDALRHPLAMLNSMEMTAMVYTSMVVVAPVIAIFGLLLAVLAHTRTRRSVEDVSLLLATGRRKGVSRSAWVVLFSGLIGPLMLGGWMTFVEPHWLEVEQVRVDIEGQDFDRPVRVVVLSDIQNFEVGAHERRMVDLVRTIDPDLIVIPGDLFQMKSSRGDADGFEEVHEDFLALFRELASIAPSYFSPGNCEWNYDERSMVDESGVVYLSNLDTALIEIAGGRVLLAGTDFALLPFPQWIEPFLEHCTSIADQRDAGLILLSHSPDSVARLPEDSRVDLTISGHTHGGQIRVPFFGPIFTATIASRSIAGGGLGEHNGNTIYVSRGVGVQRLGAPRIRLNCRPIIGVIELE